MNRSYWEQTTFFKQADVLIVGAGIVGVNTAIELKLIDPNLRVLVLDRGSLPSGASTKNAGFACVGSISEIADDLTTNSYEAVTALIWKRWQGLQKLKSRVGKREMDYVACGGYELFESNDISKYDALMAQLNHTFKNEFEAPLYRINTDKTTALFPACIETTCEGALHPGKMMQRLIALAQEKSVEFLWGCELRSWKEDASKVLLDTNLGHLAAGEVLFASNGFTKQLLPDLEVQPARNQVLITGPISSLPWQGTFHVDKGYIYFRNVGNRLLLGGARNIDPEGETTAEFGHSESIQTYLTDFLQQKLLPNSQVSIENWWSGIMGVGPTKRAIVKQISDRISLAVRLGGMGVALGSKIAEEAAILLRPQ